MLSGGTDVNINLLHLDTRELEKRSINAHFPDPHIFAGYNGLVKSALNVISVFQNLLWMLHITQYCDGGDFHNLCHIFLT